MKYYNKSGVEIEFDPSISFKLNEGSFGKVYALDSKKCLKLVLEKCPIEAPVLEEIKSLKLHHYDSLIDIFYDLDGNLKGYVMHRYNNMIPDLFSMDTCEFLREFKSLIRDCDTLTNHRIKICDSSYRNTLYHHNTIKMIDYDLYQRSKSPKLQRLNYIELLRTIEEILQHQRFYNGYTDIVDERVISGIFNYYSGNVDSVINCFKDKRLVIDAFRK